VFKKGTLGDLRDQVAALRSVSGAKTIQWRHSAVRCC